MNHKQELIELSAKNVLRCIFGNTKFNHDIQLQYDFIMQEANLPMKELIKSIIRYRGILNDN